MVEHRTGTQPAQVRFPAAARDFSPRVHFQYRLSYGVRTPPCAIACINICAHVKDPVVHVRVRWIMETLKTASMHRKLGSTTLSQLAFSGEGNPNFPREKSHWDNTAVKSKNDLKKKKKRTDHVFLGVKTNDLLTYWMWRQVCASSATPP